jgi:serine/threonine-protein kinase
MAFVDLATGSDFGGRYRVVRRLASGGMGTVYEVVHLETERRRALKVMQADLFQNAALRERFRNEARVTAGVRSDFLADVFDAGVDSATGMPFLVMELLVGEDLGRRVERLGARPHDEVVSHLSQVASALDKTHAASIVHRDLKPANLFLAELEDGSSRVKILDFGISKIVSEATSDGGTSRTLGTPAYMSPEQLLGERVSPATDIHALGLIAYTLLVGQSYWQQDVESVDNVFAFALRAQEGPREDPLARAARQGHPLPAAFAPWFERATARDPGARFQRASAAVAALAEALGVRSPGAAVAVSGSHSMSVDALTIPGERAAFGGMRWLAVPAALLVALGLFSLLGEGARRADAPPAPSVARATPVASSAAPVAVPPAASLATSASSAAVVLQPRSPEAHENRSEPRSKGAPRLRSPARVATAAAPAPVAASSAPAVAPPPAPSAPSPPPPPARAERPLHHTRD